MIRSHFLLAFFAGPVLGLNAHAADWPEFRGPTRQGVYQGKPLPTQWDAKTNIVWKQTIPGLGWSSPAIAAGKVFLTTATPGAPSERDQSLRALCLNAETGEIIWNVEVFHQDGQTAPAIQGKNSHASASPLVRAGKVYVHFGHQGTACLSLEGQVIWRNREVSYAPVHGNGGSPLLHDGLLIFCCDGDTDPFVVALDAETGKVKWKTARTWDHFKKFAFSTPLAIHQEAATQIVAPGAGGVAAYDAKTGAEIWKVRYGGYSVVPRPVLGHGLVFVSTSYDFPTLLAIRPDGHGDVTDSRVAWTLKRGAPHNPSPLLLGDELYVVSDQGLATCLDGKSGKVHWQERIKGNYSASPLAAEGLLYFLNETGLTTIVEARTAFKKVSENTLGERTLASPAAVDGALFIRTDKHLYRIEQK
jgi:outer membrane protein assembly factor BamB